MSNAKNFLLNVHKLLIAVSVNFRDRVCEECSWSKPTFYRKLKDNSFSNADREMMLAVFDEVYFALKDALPEER
ncbi:hypothetical protein ACDQ55_14975 [Chitinophaga sp. 30R24]|uniref:hypothetical protein n=1 Tax=Chitinophaga sp. 30R24 TaxID=3248838 RepID=UPI003B918CC7